MKKIILLLNFIVILSYNSRSQKIDTIGAKVIWIKDLKECFLIGIISICNANDTRALISPIENLNNEKLENRIQIGNYYILAVEPRIVIPVHSNRYTIEYKKITIWTNEQPYKLIPRLCFNCIGDFIK